MSRLIYSSGTLHALTYFTFLQSLMEMSETITQV